MIELMNLGSNIVACRVTGKIERADLTRLFEEVDRQSANGARLRVYAEIGDLSFMNLIDVAQDLKSWSTRKHLISQLNRAAVVTDSALVRQGMQFMHQLPNSVEVQVFSTTEVEQARRWIET
jgi:hypothetical protein